jgi:hypothetical protein
MASKDDYRKIARIIKKELDADKLAFKTYQRDRFSTELKAIAGSGGHSDSTDTWEEIETAFIHEGLLVFPSLNQTEEDGYTRVYRSGSLIAGLLNAMRFPGGGSDEELSALIGKVKRTNYNDQN